MRLRSSPNVVVTTAIVAVSFLMVCVPAVGAARASPSTAGPAGGSAQWAYGALKTVTRSGQGLLYSYQASATLGFGVVLRETSGASGTYTVTVNRTMGMILSVDYCRLVCTHLGRSGTVLYHAWESVHANLTLTPDASVLVNGTSTVPALGLISSNISVQVGLDEASQAMGAGAVLGTRNLTVLVDGTSATTFAPALGLMPLNVKDKEAWSATSSFGETGYALWSIVESGTGSLVPTAVDDHGSIDLNRTGEVSISGSYGGTTVRLGGTDYDPLNLSLSGPFTLREGFLLVPASSDLFGPTAPNWLQGNTTNPAGSASVSEASMDVTRSLTGGGHLGFGASGLLWRSQATNPLALALPGGGPAVSPAVEPAAGSNTTYLQGAPESVGQATTDQHCLMTGLGCTSPGSSRGPVAELWVLGGAAVALVVVLALVAERRRLPPPVYPNSTLYPPGTTSAPARGTASRPGPQPPPAEDDPLGHLW